MGALALAGTLGARTGRAEPARDPARPSIVQLVATGDARTTSALDPLVRELVSELPVELEWSVSRAIDPRQVLARRADDRRVLVRAWVDLSDPKRAKIYVANGESARFIVRFVPEPNGYDAVAREALGQILESSIAAFVADADAGISREEAVQEVAHEDPAAVAAPRPEKPREQPTRPGPTERIDVGLAYQGAMLDSRTLQHGISLSSGVSFGDGGSPRFVARATLGYRARARFETENIALGLSGETARLAVGFEGDATKRLALGALLGGGIDVVFVEPEQRSGATLANSTTHDVEPFLSLMGTAKLRLAGVLGVFVGLGAELDLSHPRYGVDGADGLTPVFTPWVVRPAVLLGLVARFGGRRGEIE